MNRDGSVVEEEAVVAKEAKELCCWAAPSSSFLDLRDANCAGVVFASSCLRYSFSATTKPTQVPKIRTVDRAAEDLALSLAFCLPELSSLDRMLMCNLF